MPERRKRTTRLAAETSRSPSQSGNWTASIAQGRVRSASTPIGLTRPVPCTSPGWNAEKTAMKTEKKAANLTTHLQRREISRPSGKYSGRKTSISTAPGTHSHCGSQAIAFARGKEPGSASSPYFAYLSVNTTIAKQIALTRRNQPTGLAGRREATMPPTSALDTRARSRTDSQKPPRLKNANATAPAIKTRERPQSSHATLGAAWLPAVIARCAFTLRLLPCVPGWSHAPHPARILLSDDAGWPSLWCFAPLPVFGGETQDLQPEITETDQEECE